MVRLVALIALAGCGRFGFDAATDAAANADRDATVDVLLGHDEDGDGVPDDVDTCPHIVAPQDDGDGDRVGDACDPRPTLAGDQILPSTR